jgi:hypothetical protein
VLAASAQIAPDSLNGSISGAPAITACTKGNNTRPLITVPQSDRSTAVASNNCGCLNLALTLFAKAAGSVEYLKTG